MNNGRDCKHGQLARSCEICGLEAENAALKSDALEWQRTHTAQANTIDALKLEHKECVRCLGEALQEATDEHLKNDALKAELAAMRDQKPVAWAMTFDDGEFIDAICPKEHGRCEGQYTVPLYAAPGANHG